jgi:hypothetical protein
MQRSLEEQRAEFASRRLIAMPLAGMMAWSVVAMGAVFLEQRAASLLLFVATGMIVYLGMLISRFTGENFVSKKKPKNTFDGLFLCTVGMALLVYGIAIPIFMIEPRSLALTVGILSGLMWLPLSWIIQHWIGAVHAIVRTLGIVAVWVLFPEHSMLAVALMIVALYAMVIPVLELRYRHQGGSQSMPA